MRTSDSENYPGWVPIMMKRPWASARLGVPFPSSQCESPEPRAKNPDHRRWEASAYS